MVTCSVSTMRVNSGLQVLEAVKRQKVKVLRKLLAMGAPLDVTDSKGRTALHYASALKSVECVRSLTEAGALCNSMDSEGYTALHLAAGYGGTEVVDLLLSAGAQPNVRDHAGRSPRDLVEMVLAGTRNPQPGMQEVLSKLSGLSDDQRCGNDQRLVAAAEAGDSMVVQDILSEGLPLQLAKGQEALSVAARCGFAEIVEQLVNAGVTVDARDMDHTTPLMLAADAGHETCIQVLVAVGADLEACDKVGVTPLIAAAYKGRSSAVMALLHAGASTATKAQGGVTPLLAASEGGCGTCVTMLLEAGADASSRTNEGKTALMHACAGGRHAAAEVLIQASDVCASDTEGLTPLHHASQAGSVACARALLDAGADVTRRCRKGRTALDQARMAALDDPDANSAIVSLLQTRWMELEAAAASQQDDLLRSLRDESQQQLMEDRKKKKKKKSKRRQAHTSSSSECDKGDMPRQVPAQVEMATGGKADEALGSGSEEAQHSSEGFLGATSTDDEIGGEWIEWRRAHRSHRKQKSAPASEAAALTAPPPPRASVQLSSLPASRYLPSPAGVEASFPAHHHLESRPLESVPNPYAGTARSREESQEALGAVGWTEPPPESLQAALPAAVGGQLEGPAKEGPGEASMVAGALLIDLLRQSEQEKRTEQLQALLVKTQQQLYNARVQLWHQGLQLATWQGHALAAESRENELQVRLAHAQRAALRHAEAALAAGNELEELRFKVDSQKDASRVNVWDERECAEKPSWCPRECCAGEVCALAGHCLYLEEKRWDRAAAKLAKSMQFNSPQFPPAVHSSDREWLDPFTSFVDTQPLTQSGTSSSNHSLSCRPGLPRSSSSLSIDSLAESWGMPPAIGSNLQRQRKQELGAVLLDGASVSASECSSDQVMAPSISSSTAEPQRQVLSMNLPEDLLEELSMPECMPAWCEERDEDLDGEHLECALVGRCVARGAEPAKNAYCQLASLEHTEPSPPFPEMAWAGACDNSVTISIERGRFERLYNAAVDYETDGEEEDENRDEDDELPHWGLDSDSGTAEWSLADLSRLSAQAAANAGICRPDEDA